MFIFIISFPFTHSFIACTFQIKIFDSQQQPRLDLCTRAMKIAPAFFPFFFFTQICWSHVFVSWLAFIPDVEPQTLNKQWMWNKNKKKWPNLQLHFNYGVFIFVLQINKQTNTHSLPIFQPRNTFSRLFGCGKVKTAKFSLWTLFFFFSSWFVTAINK